MSIIKKILFPIAIIISSQVQAQDHSAAIDYIEKYKNLAIEEQLRAGIPAAIKLAQGLHETAFGKSELCVNANNHFGIKCKATWTGETYTYTDDRKDECFRKYNDDVTSYKDHSDFLKNNPRYSNLFQYSVEDYKLWAYGLKKAGYATSPTYAQRLIETIEKYNLNDFTLLALNKTQATNDLAYTAATNTISYQTNLQEISSPIATEDITIKETKTNSTINNLNSATNSQQENAESKEYYVTSRLNNLKGFWAPKGSMLLEYAIKNRVRYSKILEINELPDAPLVAEMFIYLEKKHSKGLEEKTTLQNNETLSLLSQRTGVALSQLRAYNNIPEHKEPIVGSEIYLQDFNPNSLQLIAANEATPPTLQVNTPPSNTRKTNDDYIVIKKEETSNTTAQITQTPATSQEVDTKQATKFIENNTNVHTIPSNQVETILEDAINLQDEKSKTADEINDIAQAPSTSNSIVNITPQVTIEEEDLSHLSPYERLKRHMDKQVNIESKNSAYYEEELAQLGTDARNEMITQPAKNTTSTTIKSNTNNATKQSVPRYHIVKKGETLNSIATKYKVPLKDLQTWNKGVNKLQIGQKIKISK